MIDILMPIAGDGGPFAAAGEAFPKSLIEVRGHALVEYAVRTATPDEAHRFIFVISAEANHHRQLSALLRRLAPSAEIVVAPQRTGGALCTALLAIDSLVSERPLLVCNGDQYLVPGVAPALADFRGRALDVGIITFPALHPRWSFAALGENGQVEEVAEKRTISEHATAGLYYFRETSAFIDAGFESLRKHVVHAGQFYLAPSINQAILRGAAVGIWEVSRQEFHPLGTPNDVEEFRRAFPVSPIAHP